jgi:hypothetical protein
MWRLGVNRKLGGRMGVGRSGGSPRGKSRVSGVGVGSWEPWGESKVVGWNENWKFRGEAWVGSCAGGNAEVSREVGWESQGKFGMFGGESKVGGQRWEPSNTSQESWGFSYKSHPRLGEGSSHSFTMFLGSKPRLGFNSPGVCRSSRTCEGQGWGHKIITNVSPKGK